MDRAREKFYAKHPEKRKKKDLESKLKEERTIRTSWNSWYKIKEEIKNESPIDVDTAIKDLEKEFRLTMEKNEEMNQPLSPTDSLNNSRMAVLSRSELTIKLKAIKEDIKHLRGKQMPGSPLRGEEKLGPPLDARAQKEARKKAREDLLKKLEEKGKDTSDFSCVSNPLLAISPAIRDEDSSMYVIHNDIVYLAGQVPTSDTLSGDAETQTKSCLSEIDKYLAKAGSNNSRILSATVYLTTFDSYDMMNKAWVEWLPEGCAPARTTIGNVSMARKDCLIQIQIIAAVKKWYY
jgi:enamine deaminase RidA (YjgF/YER057c/UK114 family)